VVTLLSKVPGLLASVDRSVLASYCQAYARWRDAEKRLEEEGKTVMITGQNGNSVAAESPWIVISKAYHHAMMKAAREIGFTPAETDMNFPLFFSQLTLQDMFDQAVKLLRAREDARAVKELLSSQEFVLEEQCQTLGLLAKITWRILTPTEMSLLACYCRAWERYQQAGGTGKA
jgi:P27 family predicted phage terminase small subunit